jgi:hypothetical protein
MDLAINSQVQSPLVRTLSTVPTKSSSFTHNIPDNIPPVSFTRIENNAYTPATLQGQTWQFRVPQYGYLEQTYLKVNFTFTVGFGDGTPLDVKFQDEELSSLVTKLVKSVTLQTHNKQIQTLYGREIYARVLRLPTDERRAWLRAMTGVQTTDYITLPTYPIGTTTTASQTIEMLIPLHFASTVAPHVNYSTRFVEDLEVWVETNTGDILGAAGSGGAGGTDATLTNLNIKLVTLFHNFHDTTEQAIRNENFQRGVPASVLQYDTDEQMAVDMAAEGLETRVRINSNHYAYGFSIALIKDHTSIAAAATVAPPDKMPSEIALWASGQKLWSSSVLEYSCPIKRSFNLSTRTEYKQGYANASDFSASTVLSRPVNNFIYHRLGLQHNELMNSGGMALQTLNNPEIVITWPEGKGPTTAIKTHVYVHYNVIVRIDPDNGVITRSLDV